MNQLAALRAGVLLLAALWASPGLSAEGMFLLHDLPGPRLARSGLKVPPATLRSLSKAVVQVASGGTGSFVSPRGLVITNHHVAYRCLALLGSQKQHLGLLQRGHRASRLEEELPCPGYDLLVVEDVRDVRKAVLAAVRPKMTWAARYEAIRLRREELVADCQAGGQRICEVAALDGGAGFLLSVYRRIRDVRLVWAPPEALGKFGGDIDNWMFPRHTADVSLLRAYVSPAGAAAAYARENVPLSTPVHLSVFAGGLRRGSLVEVIGFPGRTMRHLSSHALRFFAEESLPASQELLAALIEVLNSRREQSAEARRRYAALDAGLQNAEKYYRMTRDGLQRWKPLERRLADEQRLREKLEAEEPARAERMRELLREMEGVYQRHRSVYRRHALLGRVSGICPSMRAAYDLVKWSREKAKPDRLRKEERYKEKNIYRVAEALGRLDGEIELATERALLTRLLREGQRLPTAERPRSTAWLLAWSRRELKRRPASRPTSRPSIDDGLDQAVELLYSGTGLLARSDEPGEQQRAAGLRRQLFEMAAPAFRGQQDPLLRFAREVEGELHALKEGPAKELEQRLGALLVPQWVEEVVRPAYHDANFTVRLAFGSVQDYRASATGKAHAYATTLAGLLAKDRGKPPFEVPPALRAAFPGRAASPYFDAALKDVPVNFTATLDTTGGNSGSPVLDDRGRLVGLLFDGTPESILSDWLFLPREQRSICLDVRFALYLMDLDRQHRLLGEMGVR